MDEGSFNPPTNNNPSSSIFGNIDCDFMDQLLGEGCWLQTAGFSNPGPSTSSCLSYPSPPLLNFEANSKAEDQKSIIPTSKSSWVGNELNKIMWIAPRENSGSSTSVQERLIMAIFNLRDMNRNRDVLIQLWVPIKKGIKSFLTTVQQPHFFHPTNTKLLHFRDVSEKYEFPTDEHTKEAVGLPGRVFLGKAPEWTPNVCYFRQEEYPRVNYAQVLDVRGSIALPVFERGSGDCLGVVEVITTTEKINYGPEVESVCKALESVNLRSSEILDIPQELGEKGSYEAIIPEILNVLRNVCETHNLPLAQTWAPCSQQGKSGCWHSDKNALCVSTLDSACYVNDHRVLDFHRACSEHHLLRGRGGIVGKAFETNQPCFAIDVTEFSKADYPLSHHAKMFGLRAVIAIQLHNIYQKSNHYVLEFYLPSDSMEKGLSLHDRIWKLISMTLQQNCRSLQFSGKVPQNNHQEETSWISNVMDPKRKGKEVALSLDFGEEDEPDEEFRLDWSNSETDLQLGHGFSSCENIEQDSPLRGRLPLRKAGEKRRTKAQKTISLQVLRQYFAGSLKDAAKSIGVCPTTLKRICRQHGITRWPSRKIKKVDHSLRKLQMVIDSVHGAQGAIKLASFYTNFPELNSPNTQSKVNQFSSLNLNDQPIQQQQPITQPEGNKFSSSGATTSSSPSTSSSQTSTSSQFFSSGPKISPNISINVSVKSEAQNISKHVLERSQSNKTLTEHPFLETNLPPLPVIAQTWRTSREVGTLKAKATFGEEKIRFTILPNMGFREFQEEIMKRFSFEDLSNICIKYLDDDKEWVLLTCDDDLEECIDIHRSSGTNRVKLTLSPISGLGGSLGSRGLS